MAFKQQKQNFNKQKGLGGLMALTSVKNDSLPVDPNVNDL